MRTRQSQSLAGSPLLIGATTVLITLVAVFLAYNANSGLPFVPTYDITVQVPDAAGLTRGNEVRIGGAQVGLVTAIRAQETSHGPIALLDLKLDRTVQPLHRGTQVIIRPRSPLGLKYLQVTPSRSGAPVPPHGVLSVSQATPTVDLDQVLNAFDAATRQSLDGTLVGLGDGLAGRGITFNEAVADAPPLFKSLTNVAANLADPATGLHTTITGAAATTQALAAAGGHLGSFVHAGSTTAGALAGVTPQLEQSVSGLPPTESIGTSALATATPVLHDARLFLHDIRPGADVLASSAAKLHTAIRTGIPVVRRALSLAGRLNDTLAAVRTVSSDPQTSGALDRLLSTALSALPTAAFLVPAQTVCNYYGLWFRNVDSVISEGDASGTFLRTLVVPNVGQSQARAAPAPDLHINPYPNSAAPGQVHECEAGNEPYLPGQQFGNVPGNQGTHTESTSPPPGVGR